MSARCPATAAVRAGIDADTAFGAVTPPLVLSSNFSFAGFGQKRKYDYTRSGNPTRDQLADALDALAPVTGDVELSGFPSGYDFDGRVWFGTDDPLPFNLVAIMPRVQSN